MPRPNTVLGLSRELVRTTWQRLGRGARIGLVALLLAVATGLVLGSGMFSCPSHAASGCPYSGR